MPSKAELRKKTQDWEQRATLAHIACRRAESAEETWRVAYQKAAQQRDNVQKTLDELRERIKKDG